MSSPYSFKNLSSHNKFWLKLVSSIFLVVLTFTIILYLREQFPELNNNNSISSILGFSLLININIIVVLILVFLVVKNLLTLVLERKRKILGSRLRTRLVTAFVGLSLIPTVMLFLVAKGILESVLQAWFSPQIVASVEGALSVAQHYSNATVAELSSESKFIGNKLVKDFPKLQNLKNDNIALRDAHLLDVKSFLVEKREELNLFSLAIYNLEGEELLSTVNEEQAQLDKIPPIKKNYLERAKSKEVFVKTEPFAKGELARGFAPIIFNQDRIEYILVVSTLISAELSHKLNTVINSYDDYKELRTYRRPLASTYLLTLVVVTLLIVFTAIWVGFYLSKSLSVPIGLLAQATSEVAHGNLHYQLPETGDDELSVLVRSFNKMTADLAQITGELVSRRRYMETIFANIAIGVISFDKDFYIRACNIATAEMLGMDDAEKMLNRPLEQGMPQDLAKSVRNLFSELANVEEKYVESNVSLTINSIHKHFQITLTKFSSEQEPEMGGVLIIDDITELVSAQRMAAWREVARRIAHEIKNPLTPIQLCAQRMQRRFSAQAPEQEFNEKDREIIVESTDIIVQQVEDLRSLVNEFSRFARMPKVTLRIEDLNKVLFENMLIYKEAHPDINFILELDERLPHFLLDREQISRVVINLLDNAVASVKACFEVAQGLSSNYQPQIKIKTLYDNSLSLVTASISDNGTGIKEEDKPKLFEPYFSTKRGGTGLGLAIVSSIVTDHNGFIRVKDNVPQGVSFVIELPVTFTV